MDDFIAIANGVAWVDTLRLALEQLFETTIESYQYDIMHRKVVMHCVNPSTHARYAVVIFGVAMFAGIDEKADSADSSVDLSDGYLECSDVCIPKDKNAFVARISYPEKVDTPVVSMAANLIVDIWGCMYLYIRAKGISINGREFLL